MSRIGIDSRMVAHSGIGTYLRGLLQAYDQDCSDEIDQFSLHGGNDFSFLKNSWKHYDFSPPIYSLGEQFGYRQQLERCRLWHSVHYNIPYNKGKTKLVVTIHDIIHWIFRKKFLSPAKQFYAGIMLRRAVEHSDHIITVSEATKKDLIHHFKASEEKITVTYEGVSDYFRKLDPEECTADLKSIQLPNSFFLYVGLIKPHKNVQWLVENFIKLKKEHALNEDLVIVGKRDKTYPQGYELLSKLEEIKGVHYISYATKPQLRALYNRAKALIHPSLYEGFGLTLLEAMACETPVIASSAASLPEVAGDAGLLVDPTSASDLQNAMLRLSGDQNFCEQLTARGLQQIKRFSWNKMAKETMNVYERVLGQP